MFPERLRMKQIRQTGNILEKSKKCQRHKPLCDKVSGVPVCAKPLFAGSQICAMLSFLILQGFGGIGPNFGKPLSKRCRNLRDFQNQKFGYLIRIFLLLFATKDAGNFHAGNFRGFENLGSSSGDHKFGYYPFVTEF